MTMLGHLPVMLTETVDALDVRKDGIYVDGTLGRAGHSREILRRGAARVLGIDRDDQALSEVRELKLKGLDAVKGRHGDLAEIARANGIGEADGVLLDLGVSSPQLDKADRGFSFRADGPLDMRMDRSSGETAAEIVATRSAGELAEIFRTLGEEPNAGRLAKAIVREREAKPFSTTMQLADFIEKTLGRRGAHHPATRAFQALRMAVNDEMGELERALEGALALLKPGGRLAVITFESLTDRMTKKFFAAHAGREVSQQAGGSKWEGALPRVRLVAKRAITAGEEELAANPRSRSAKLRAAEKTRTI